MQNPRRELQSEAHGPPQAAVSIRVASSEWVAEVEVFALKSALAEVLQVLRTALPEFVCVSSLKHVCESVNPMSLSVSAKLRTRMAFCRRSTAVSRPSGPGLGRLFGDFFAVFDLEGLETAVDSRQGRKTRKTGYGQGVLGRRFLEH